MADKILIDQEHLNYYDDKIKSYIDYKIVEGSGVDIDGKLKQYLKLKGGEITGDLVVDGEITLPTTEDKSVTIKSTGETSGFKTIEDPTDSSDSLATTEFVHSAIEEDLMQEVDLTNGIDYVDLGLTSGTLWATCNLGANSPEEYGDYFSWAEITPKERYREEDYKYIDSEGNYTKYNLIDNKQFLDNIDDAARVIFKGGWRIPSYTNIQELVEECEWEQTTDPVNGFVVTGTNGNSIFLPASGWFVGSTLAQRGQSGTIWSNTVAGDSDESIFVLHFSQDRTHSTDLYARHIGLAIRPVLAAATTTIKIPRFLPVSTVEEDTFIVDNKVSATDFLIGNDAEKSLSWVLEHKEDKFTPIYPLKFDLTEDNDRTLVIEGIKFIDYGKALPDEGDGTLIYVVNTREPEYIPAEGTYDSSIIYYTFDEATQEYVEATTDSFIEGVTDVTGLFITEDKDVYTPYYWNEKTNTFASFGSGDGSSAKILPGKGIEVNGSKISVKVDNANLVVDENSDVITFTEKVVDTLEAVADKMEYIGSGDTLPANPVKGMVFKLTDDASKIKIKYRVGDYSDIIPFDTESITSWEEMLNRCKTEGLINIPTVDEITEDLWNNHVIGGDFYQQNIIAFFMTMSDPSDAYTLSVWQPFIDVNAILLDQELNLFYINENSGIDEETTRALIQEQCAYNVLINTNSLKADTYVYYNSEWLKLHDSIHLPEGEIKLDIIKTVEELPETGNPQFIYVLKNIVEGLLMGTSVHVFVNNEWKELITSIPEDKGYIIVENELPTEDIEVDTIYIIKHITGTPMDDVREVTGYSTHMYSGDAWFSLGSTDSEYSAGDNVEISEDRVISVDLTDWLKKEDYKIVIVGDENLPEEGSTEHIYVQKTSKLVDDSEITVYSYYLWVTDEADSQWRLLGSSDTLFDSTKYYEKDYIKETFLKIADAETTYETQEEHATDKAELEAAVRLKQDLLNLGEGLAWNTVETEIEGETISVKYLTATGANSAYKIVPSLASVTEPSDSFIYMVYVEPEYKETDISTEKFDTDVSKLEKTIAANQRLRIKCNAISDCDLEKVNTLDIFKGYEIVYCIYNRNEGIYTYELTYKKDGPAIVTIVPTEYVSKFYGNATLFNLDLISEGYFAQYRYDDKKQAWISVGSTTSTVDLSGYVTVEQRQSDLALLKICTEAILN